VGSDDEPRRWSSQPPATFTTQITEGRLLEVVVYGVAIQDKALGERIEKLPAILINYRLALRMAALTPCGK
jgi:hypothetical protein